MNAAALASEAWDSTGQLILSQLGPNQTESGKCKS
jgi:hypothetical protein